MIWPNASGLKLSPILCHSHCVALEGKTPTQVWLDNDARDYNMLKIFDYHAYYHIREGKFNPRSKKTTFMGFIMV